MAHVQAKLWNSSGGSGAQGEPAPLPDQLLSWREFGKETVLVQTVTGKEGSGERHEVDTYVNEFWTSRQRAANSLHEVSYRACFKPQLPRFFIQRLTSPGDVVYDPFMGRGTTLLEAALMGRTPWGCDINPLSAVLIRPRLNPPTIRDVAERLDAIDFSAYDEYPEELLVFYHPETLAEICALKRHLLTRTAQGSFDTIDDWIRMVAVSRLTGHSSGFFSVYTLPPNQAVSLDAQRKINERRGQTPQRREAPDRILRKSRQLLSQCDGALRRRLALNAGKAMLVTGAAASTARIPSGSVSLVVTSPPFLDVVDYAQDNWLRCWFCGIDPQEVSFTVPKGLDQWREAMSTVFGELARVLKPGGYVAFEVGEVRGGRVKLEESVVPCGAGAGLEPVLILINDQEFTKTANCWGVDNNRKGTNTNRVVLFRKAPDHAYRQASNRARRNSVRSRASSLVRASTSRRASGSVPDGRTQNHQSG